jgi:uridylate kinase
MKLMFKRVMLKLSGELLMGDLSFGIDSKVLARIAQEITEISNLGSEVIIEIGGGNIYRFKKAQKGVRRHVADTMGMLGSIMNALNLRDALALKKEARALSPIFMPSIVQLYAPTKAIHYLDEKHIVIIGGGTGDQFFTTDTGAVLHALQTECDVILKGTNVDGVYSVDPKINPKAKKYGTLSFDEAISKKLAVMDATAFSLARDNKLSIIVFDATKPGNIKKVVMGEKIGTIVK